MNVLRRLGKGTCRCGRRSGIERWPGGIAVNVLASIFFLALIMGDRSVAAFVSATHLQYLS